MTARGTIPSQYFIATPGVSICPVETIGRWIWFGGTMQKFFLKRTEPLAAEVRRSGFWAEGKTVALAPSKRNESGSLPALDDKSHHRMSDDCWRRPRHVCAAKQAQYY
jgi:hypothetical protein